MSGPYWTIPPGTPAHACRACQATIYFVRSRTGNNMPIDSGADERCKAPTATEPGSGLSHFATCPKADQFRKAKAP